MTPAVPTSIAVMQNSDGASTLSALTLSEVWASSPTWQVGILRAFASEQEFPAFTQTCSQSPFLTEAIKAS